MTAIAKPYRYQLPRKAIKSDCPQCSPKHLKTLSRYVDTQTDEPLPDIYGRCDRESNCGYHLSPYYKGPSGMSYTDEGNKYSRMLKIPKAWFRIAREWKRNTRATRENIVKELQGDLVGATSEQAEIVAACIYDKQPSLLKSIPKPIYCIPDEVFTQSLGHYKQNQFAMLLVRQFGKCEAEELLKRFQIGTSSRWPGACVFWLIDEQNRKRGGQIKLFGSDWHTVKYVDRNGHKRTKTSWVHSVLKYRLEKDSKPVPDWLTEYDQNAERSPCLFGLPQLLTEPINKPIGIVEAPKTAVIATGSIPDFIWLSVGSLSYLNAERLAPLRHRTVRLFPDLNAYSDWSRRTDLLRKEGFRITVSDYLEKQATEEEKGWGLDLADFILRQAPAGDQSTETPCYPQDIKATVKTPAEQLAIPGSTFISDESTVERLAVEPACSYPEEWDEPSSPGAIPPICVRTFHEWQCSDSHFSQLGIKSIENYIVYEKGK